MISKLLILLFSMIGCGASPNDLTMSTNETTSTSITVDAALTEATTMNSWTVFCMDLTGNCSGSSYTDNIPSGHPQFTYSGLEPCSSHDFNVSNMVLASGLGMTFDSYSTTIYTDPVGVEDLDDSMSTMDVLIITWSEMLVPAESYEIFLDGVSVDMVAGGTTQYNYTGATSGRHTCKVVSNHTDDCVGIVESSISCSMMDLAVEQQPMYTVLMFGLCLYMIFV